MRYCENCGTQLSEGIKFCEECGAPIEVTVETAVEQPAEAEIPDVLDQTQCVDEQALLEPESKPIPDAIHMTNDSKQELRYQEEKKSDKSNKKKTGIIVGIIVILLAIAGVIVLWQFGILSESEQPAAKEPVHAVDQNNLYGTLNWKADQDQEYTLKNALIEGNSDANVKEIFEESAYFTPQAYRYAVNGKQTYYQIACQYEKKEKTVPYVLVFQVNKQEHLWLKELYKNKKKIDKAKFDSFYKKLYKTKEQVEAEKAEAKQKEQENMRAKLPSDIYAGVKNQYFYDIEVINSEYFQEESEYSYIYVKSIDSDKIITEHGSLEGPYDLTFYRVDDKSNGSYSYGITLDESGWSDEITLTKDDLANQDGYYKIIYTTYENGLPYRINEYQTIWW